MSQSLRSREEIEEIKKGIMPLNMIWGAMLGSLFMYLVVGLYTRNTINIPMEKDVLDKLRLALYAASFVTLTATRSIRKFILNRKPGIISRTTVPPKNPVIARYTTAMVIALALSESIGIYGLILFFMGKNAKDLSLFLLVAAAAMISYRPREEEIISLARTMNQLKSGTTERA